MDKHFKVIWAHLHDTLFYPTKKKANWGDKIDLRANHKHDIELVYHHYETGQAELEIKSLTTDDPAMFIPCTMVKGYIRAVEHEMHSLVRDGANVKEVEFPMPLQDRKKPGPKPKIPEAQVSTPHSHVFAGEGAGKTNDR